MVGKLLNRFGLLYSKIFNIIHKNTFIGSRLKSVSYDFSCWEAPKQYKNIEIGLPNARGYWLYKKNSEHKKAIYQLHGGAFIMQFKKKYNSIALKYSRCYQDADVFSLDYRTYPEHSYPAAHEDVLDGYKWLLEQGYETKNIIVCGDSAGGGLALSLVQQLQREQIPLPKLLILSSPWADMTAEGSSYQENITKDIFFGVYHKKIAPRHPVPISYAGESDLHNPQLSPVYADFHNFPPILIQTGSEEVLLSDTLQIVEKAERAGVEVKKYIHQNMFHIFYIVLPWLKESRNAWNNILHFINEHI